MPNYEPSWNEDALEYWLASHRAEVRQCVRQTYQLFSAGKAIEAPPVYVRFPHDASARIIAKPAQIDDGDPVAGIKWISSFPSNLARGRPRAGGLLILNDGRTGDIRAVLPAAPINAHRTAASAALGATCLGGPPRVIADCAVVGCGLIARRTVEYLLFDGWSPRHWRLFDTRPQAALDFKTWLEGRAEGTVQIMPDAAGALHDSEVVVFATTSTTPSLDGAGLFAAHQTILHLSLRDIGPGAIAEADNYTDSVELGVSHATSLALAVESTGRRDFLKGGIEAVLASPQRGTRPVIFAPFGLAVLDLGLARVIEAAAV